MSPEHNEGDMEGSMHGIMSMEEIDKKVKKLKKKAGMSDVDDLDTLIHAVNLGWSYHKPGVKSLKLEKAGKYKEKFPFSKPPSQDKTLVGIALYYILNLGKK